LLSIRQAISYLFIEAIDSTFRNKSSQSRLSRSAVDDNSPAIYDTSHEKTFASKSLLQIKHNLTKLECGPMPNVMVALPNTGGALCSTPQSLADAHY